MPLSSSTLPLLVLASLFAAPLPAMAKTKIPTKPQRKVWQHEHPLFMWYAVAATIGAFMLANLVRIAFHHLRRRSGAKSVASMSEKNEFAAPAQSSTLASIPNKAAGKINKHVLWRDFAVKLWIRVPVGEAFFSLAYTAAILVLGFIYTPIGSDVTATQAAQVYANRCGLIVYGQLPLIIGLASKNNVISFLTGISYEKLNFMHRAASRACLILTWAHVIGRSVAIPLGEKNAINTGHMVWGVVAAVSFNLLVILGDKRLLRHLVYEVFLVSHIVLAFLFLIGAVFHWKEYAYYLYPALALWAADRVARFMRVLFFNRFWTIFSKTSDGSRTALVETLHGGALKITLARPMNWHAGQHAYIVCPTVSTFPFEAHPFTIASIPSADRTAKNSNVELIVRVHDGFTGRLSTLAKHSGGRLEVPAYLDGPYGTVESLDSYQHAVLISGGSGITFTLPLALALLRSTIAGTSACRSLTFIWIVQSLDHLAWVSNELEQLQRATPASFTLDLKIFVTRAKDVPEGEMPLSDDRASITPEGSEDSSPEGSIHEEKKGEKDTQGSLARLAVGSIRGRPDLNEILGGVVREAKGGAVSVSVCGPTSLAVATKRALRSTSGENVALKIENFGW